MSRRAEALQPKSASPIPSAILQRKCACGQHAAGGKCGSCRSSQQELRRHRTGKGLATAPPIVHEVLRSPGQSLDNTARAFLEPWFGFDFSTIQGRSSEPQRASAGLAIESSREPAEEEAENKAREVLEPSTQRKRLSRGRPHDFSDVRIHTDARAAKSADAVGAAAYTVGLNIVFGAGQYRPRSLDGLGLLAHELTHVLQQGQPGRSATVQRSVSGFFSNIFRTIFGYDFGVDDIKAYLKKLKTSGKIEDDFDSDLKARQVVRQQRKFGPFSVRIKVLLAREMLTGHVSGKDERSTIDLFRSSSVQDRKAMRKAIGRDQLWGAFEGRNRNIIQALTLETADLQDPSVMGKLGRLSESQLEDYERNAVDPGVRAEIDRLLRQARHELGSYPEQERRKISVGGDFANQASEAFEADFKEAPAQEQPRSSPTPMGGALGTYSVTKAPVPQREEIPIPPQIKLEFETKIAQANRPGLRRIAAHMIRDGNLRSNLTRALAVQAAGRVYRFTRFDHRETARGGAGTTELVLIEEVGTLRPTKDLETDTWNVNQPRPSSLAAEKFKVRAFEFQRDKDWRAEEWDAVVEMLRAFPDSVLQVAAGITFKRQPCREEEIRNGICGPKPADAEAARRTGGTVANEAIILYNEAFMTSPTRYGLSTVLGKVLAHEIGHQLDLQPLDLAVDTYTREVDQARAALDLALKDQSKRSKVEQALSDYDKEKAKLDEALAKSRSRSGVFSQIEGNTRVQTDSPAPDGSNFLAAAIKDGLVLDGKRVTPKSSITQYAEKNIKEQFADLFALYFADPELLRAIRPNVYLYFASELPTGTP